jgi:hypothetical protein
MTDYQEDDDDLDDQVKPTDPVSNRYVENLAVDELRRNYSLSVAINQLLISDIDAAVKAAAKIETYLEHGGEKSPKRN